MTEATNRRLITLIRWPARLVVHRLGHDEQHAVRLLRDLLRRHWRVATLAFLAQLFAAFFEASTMGILTLALETLVGDSQSEMSAGLGTLGVLADRLKASLGQDGLFILLVVLAVVTQLLRSGLELGGAAAAAHLQSHVEGDVRSRIFRQFTAMSYAQVGRYKIGDLTSYADQARYIRWLIAKANALLMQVLMSITYIGVLLWLSWAMTLAALIVLGLMSFFLGHIISRVREAAYKYVDSSKALNEETIEFLQGLRIVHTFGREEYAVKRVDDVLSDSVAAMRQGLILRATISPLMQSLTIVGVAAFLIGAYLLLGEPGRSMFPRLAAFLLVLYRLMPRIGQINNSLAGISNVLPGLDRVVAILRTDDKQYLKDGNRPFHELTRGIEFRNVSLRYIEGEHLAVQDLSFTLPRGSMVALVGESGAGKSTVADLLLRLYDPTGGRILVDGVNLRELDLKAWRDHIGVVSQDAFVFRVSIRDNIAFGRLDATEEEIIAAARAAHAHGFIVELAEGYNTVVGDRGYRLSGGQRQRIAIARAILRNPEILVLDEATSDLDSRSERLIQGALEELRSKRTVLAIAHRLSTIMMADQILVLEQGQLVEQGTHEELLALGGQYAQLWRLQAGPGDAKDRSVVHSGGLGCDVE